MEHNIHKAVFNSPGDCISPEEFKTYHAGKMSLSDQNRIEKHLLDCDLCADAFEGWAINPGEVDAAVEDITARAWKRVGELKSAGKARTVSYAWIGAAASVFMITLLMWLYVQRTNKNQKLDQVFAEQFELPVEESAPPIEAGKGDLAMENNRNTFGEKNNQSDVSPKDEDLIAKPEDKNQLATVNESISSEMQKSIVENGNNNVPATGNTAAPDNFDDEVYADAVGADEPAEMDFDALAEMEEVPVHTLSPAPTMSKSATNVEGNPGGKENKKNSEKTSANNIKQSVTTETNVLEDVSTGGAARYTMKVTDSVTVADSEFSQGMSSYYLKDYRAATDAFNGVLSSNPNDLKANYYAGVSWLALNQPDPAITCFKRIIQAGKSEYKEDAEWYLALAYIRKKEDKNAKPLLENLSRSGKYKQKASQTLDEIK